MSRQKRKKTKAQTDRIALSGPQLLERKVQVGRRIRRSFWTGLAISLTLAGCNWLLEETVPIRMFRQWFYDVLQLRLVSALDSRDLPIVVLDVSEVPVALKDGNATETITQRGPLREIVDAVLDKGPSAVGIDIDFSPDVKGYAAPDDEKFLAHILQMKKERGVPIYVGVNESLSLGPEEWLLKPEYMSLAACVVIPTPEKNESTRRLPEWLELHYKTQAGGDYVQKCRSIGAAIAQRSVTSVPFWAAPFVRTTTGESDKGDDPLLSPREFLVDFSPLNALSDNSPKVRDASSVGPLNLAHKVVLLGRCHQAKDTFTVPGRPERPYPGVFLHACAAYTLLQKKPLYFLTGLGRWALDLLFATLVSGSVLLIWRHRNRKVLTETAPHQLHSGFTVLVLFLLFLGAIAFVHLFRLMWDDFLLMAGGLVLHSPLERYVEKLISWFGRWIPAG